MTWDVAKKLGSGPELIADNSRAHKIHSQTYLAKYRGVSCVLHLSFVCHPPLPDVSMPIVGEMKPRTAGSEVATAEPHSQRRRWDP